MEDFEGQNILTEDRNILAKGRNILAIIAAHRLLN